MKNGFIMQDSLCNMNIFMLLETFDMMLFFENQKIVGLMKMQKMQVKNLGDFYVPNPQNGTGLVLNATKPILEVERVTDAIYVVYVR